MILVIGTHFRADYETYAHSAVARATGINEEQIKTITAGDRPSGESDEAEMAYDTAAALLKGRALAASATSATPFCHGAAPPSSTSARGSSRTDR